MRTSFFLSLLLFCTRSFAQETTFTGYYITPAGDTVNGSFPRYKQPSRSPDRISFIATGSSGTIQLTPSNCFEVSIKNFDEYKAYSGKRLLNPIDDNVAVDNRGYFGGHDSIGIVTVFLRLVVERSSCSVYILNDRDRKNLFIQVAGQPMQELRFKKYYDENNMHELAEYRQQLNNLLNEQISKRHLESNLEQLPYSEDAIAQFFQKLFPEKKQDRSTTDALSGWVIGGGVSYNMLKGVGDPMAIETQLDYPSSLAPYVSIGYIVSIQRNFNRYFLYPQVRFTNYQHSAEKISAPFKKTVTFKSELMMLPQLNVGANIVNTSSCRFYLYAGAGVTTLVDNKEVNQYFDPADNSLHATIEYKLQPLVLGLNVSAGLSLKNRLQIQVSYNFPTDLDNFVGFSTMQSSLQAGIGYKLSKH